MEPQTEQAASTTPPATYAVGVETLSGAILWHSIHDCYTDDYHEAVHYRSLQELMQYASWIVHLPPYGWFTRSIVRRVT